MQGGTGSGASESESKAVGDILDEDQTDETSAVTGTAQYTILGVDPEDSGNQLVNIYESQILGS